MCFPSTSKTAAPHGSPQEVIEFAVLLSSRLFKVLLYLGCFLVAYLNRSVRQQLETLLYKKTRVACKCT